MARKIKKKAVGAKESVLTEKKEPKVTKKTKIIIAAIVAACILAGFVIGLVLVIESQRELDYFNDDLSKYVYISEDDYKNFPVNSPLVSVTELDIEREINKLLVANKNKTPLENGASFRNREITLGDVVKIWYRAYTTDENGKKTELSSASNYSEGTPYELEIGAGTFLKEIEFGLLGKMLQDGELKIQKTGQVVPGDVVYVSYNAFMPDGSTKSVTNARIELNNATVDKTYGIGFSSFLLGKELGKSAGVNKTFKIPGEDIDVVYYDIQINYAVRTETAPYVIEVVFPADYTEPSYRGLCATFEIHAFRAVVYDTPEWNDAFIRETLKENETTLASFDGVSLCEKYENKIRRDLEKKAEDKNEEIIVTALWEQLREKMTVKKLPEREVDAVYRQYFNEVKLQYSTYGAGLGYDNIDDFACFYFGLSTVQSWRDYIRAKAEADVAERLVFYYIIDKEGLKPEGEVYTEIYEGFVNEHMEYFTELYKTEIEACETEELISAKIAEIRERMLSYYGEDYFRELVYYEHAMKTLVSYAKIN